MADTTSNHIIQYIADLTNFNSKVKELTRLNSLAAQKLTTDFSKAVDIIDQKISKISNKIIKVPVINTETGKAIPGQFQDQLKQTSVLTSTVRTADGTLQKFTETQIKLDGALKSTNLTLSALKQPIIKLNDDLGGLAGKSSQLASNFQNLNNINKNFSSQLQNFGNITRLVGTTLNEVNNTGSRTSKVFETSTGQFVKLNEVVNKSPQGIQTVQRSVTQLNNAQIGNLKTLENLGITTNVASKVSRTFSDDLKTLAGRALLTIPIWIGIRFALTSMFQTITGGVKNLIDFDLSLQKVKRNLSGTPGEIESNFKILREEVTKTSLATGKSTEQIADAIKKFATIGFGFKESLQGGIDATKLSVVLFGDAGETANAFARALKVLNDTSKNAVPIQQQMQEAFALTSQLEVTNQFDINEVTESLIKFSATAKTAGLSTRQTLSTLAALGSAGRAGAQGGTLLSTTFNNLLQNLDKVSKNFGIRFNPAVDSSFDILTKVLDKASELVKLPGGEANVITKFADVFGGEKGTKAVSSLLNVNKLLKENNATTPDVIKFNKAVASVLDSESGQAQIAANAFKEFAKSLVQGLLGGETFKDSLKELNETLLSLQKNGKIAGNVIRDFSISATTGAVGLILFKLEEDKKNLANQASILHTRIEEALNKTLNTEPLIIEKLIADIQNDKVTLSSGAKEQILKALNTRLASLKLSSTTPVDIIASSADEKSRVGNINILESDRLDLAKAVVEARLNQLRTEGALNSEIEKQRGLLDEQLSIFDSEITKANRHREIEHLINEEKKLQNRLGSDSIKLFDIAQTKGIATAKAIGDVLAGNTSFDTFVRKGGDALEVFKTEFADVFKQQQAQEFFQGNTVAGNPTLRGGANIAINETALRNPSKVTLDQQALSDFRKSIQEVGITAQTVKSMTVQSLIIPNGVFNQQIPNLLNINSTQLPLTTKFTPNVAQSLTNIKNDLIKGNAELTVKIISDGNEKVFVGTKNDLISLVEAQVSPHISKIFIDKIINNPQSPESKAINKRQEEL